MDVKKLHQKKRRAKEKGDLKILADLSKELGDYYFQVGKYEDALIEYKEQVQVCEVLADSLNIAVGNRMIGEVLTEMNMPEDALPYQNLYLEGAIASGDLIEQQRAYATLGRTHFCLSQQEERDKKRKALKAAKKAYFTSLDICNELESKRVIENKEIAMMRARLLLNVGLVYEARRKSNEATGLIKKAARLCEQNHLHEDLYRSHISLGNLYERLKSYDSAMECYKKAQNIEDSLLKSTAQLNEAELLVKMGKLTEARKILVHLYVHQKDAALRSSVTYLLKIIVAIQTGERNLETEDDNRKRLRIYEDLGDTSAAGKFYERAVDYYRSMLACAEIGEVDEKIGPALTSLACTLKDVDNYGEALGYARKELELCKDPKEICRSALFLAGLLILAHSPDSQVEEAFKTALVNAEDSKVLSLKLSVLKDMRDWYEDKGDMQKFAQVNQQIAELVDQVGDESSSDEEDEEASLSRINIELDDLSDVEEEMQKKGEKIVRKNRQKRPVFKANERGELPLQVACIKGDINRVQELLDQGHPVNCRDNAGWTPLHEAANYGFIEIAELLLKYGAHINDPGGPDCEGITPLHDAASCGHTAMINFFIERGADPRLKTVKGETVLDYLEAWRNRERTEDLSPADEAEYLIIRNKLKLIVPRTPKDSISNLHSIRNQGRSSLIDPDGEDDDPPMIASDLPDEVKISAGEDYKRTIQSLRTNRSRIMKPKSPKRVAAPLIDSEEALIDEDTWLEEDLEMPTPKKSRSSSGNETPGSVKRKSNNLTPGDEKTTKKQRSDVIEIVGDDEDSLDSFKSDNSEIFLNTSSSSRNQVKRRRKPKQGSLLTSGFTRDLDSRTPSPNFMAPDPINAQLRAQRLEALDKHTDSVRVEVEIEKYIIKSKIKPLNDNAQVVLNLTNDIINKFEELTGCRGKIGLITSSGDILQADNIVNIIYSSGEVLHLTGRVLELQVPPIVDRFQKICRAMDIEVVDSELLRSLKSCKNTGTFRLKSEDNLEVELKPILKSLEYEKSLQVLYLSSGILYGLGELVNETLVKLTGLQELHLQGCDIDYQFLRNIDHLPSQLRVLDISYNPLGSESHEKLGELITPLRQLQTLNLRSCNLKKFPTSTVTSNLVNLDISGNTIEGDSAEHLLEKQLINLSISHTHNPQNSIVRLMMRDVRTIFISLETLELTGCGIRDSDVLNLLERCQNLSKIVLGDNPEVSQVSLQALLSRKPTLMLINVTGCEEIVETPDPNLKIDNPSTCTLMASMSADVCDSWKNLWDYQAILYRQPFNIVIIRPMT